MFSWKPIYIELGQKLMAYRDKQDELLDWLRGMKKKGIPVVGLGDYKPESTPIELAEIDPFTFFANFNRGIKDQHRFEILRVLKSHMGLSSPVPQDFDGLPVVNIQKAWFFPYAYERGATTIPLLWDFAAEIVGQDPTTLSKDLFARSLEIGHVGLAKVTMGMFWLQPDRYLALDHVNRAYLEEQHGFPVKDLKPKTLQSYLGLVDSVRQKAGSDFPAISYKAFTHGIMVDIDATVLDRGIRSYMERIAEKGGYSLLDLIERIQTPEASGENEITNRTIHQKALQDVLSRGALTKEQLKAATDKLWSLGDRRDLIRRNEYFKSDEVMADIRALLDESGGIPVAVRISDFVEAAAAHGYSPESGEELTNPAQFASVLLSSRWPHQFVDFRKGRWNDLYREVTGTKKVLLRGKHYGHLLLRAGSFASLLAKTPTFQELFGKSDELWTVAGVTWALKNGPPTVLKPVAPKRYWAGGFLWGGTDPQDVKFLTGNYWQHGYARGDTNDRGGLVWALFDQIKVGDELAIKGYGGVHDLNVKYIGRVTKVFPDQGRVNLMRLDRPLYAGKAPRGEGAGNWRETLLEVTRKDVIDMIFNPKSASMISQQAVSAALPAKNIILYGPPGTGKTYALRTEYMERFTDRGTPKSRDQFADEMVAEMAWWEVSTLVMLNLKTAKVTDILEHPLMKARIRRSATKNARAGVWAHLQMHTKRECQYVAYAKRYEPLIFSKSEDSVWSIDAELASSEAPELVEALERWKTYKPSPGDMTRRCEFTTFHQSYSYEEFVEGIKPVLEGEATGDLVYEIKPGIFRQIAQRANSDRDHEYAIFIDEINRGNIASIFGELITLLEDDKRLDAKHEIKTRLPYSREEFGVPPNLYVIGTMNTADRSVEALDAALRRRFSFVPYLPDVTTLPEGSLPNLQIDLRRMLTVINGRLERLLDRDHCIGHSYFMEIAEAPDPLAALQQAFTNRVVPLLEEYFYGAPGKIGLVLGSAFVTKRPKQQEFASCDWGHGEDEDQEVFERVNPMDLGVEAFQAIYA